MDKIVSLNDVSTDKKPTSNKQFFELIDYLFSLKEKNFTGNLKIEFVEGVINQVAFNQKVGECYELSVNE
jgi:hypothetical protein